MDTNLEAFSTVQIQCPILVVPGDEDAPPFDQRSNKEEGVILQRVGHILLIIMLRAIVHLLESSEREALLATYGDNRRTPSTKVSHLFLFPTQAYTQTKHLLEMQMTPTRSSRIISANRATGLNNAVADYVMDALVKRRIGAKVMGV